MVQSFVKGCLLSEPFFQFCSNQKKRNQITVLSTIQLMKRCLGQSFETFFGYLSQREKLSENKLPLWECSMSVHTWPFWSCFFSDYCHRGFLFFSPFKRCLRINNLNFIYFDHPSRTASVKSSMSFEWENSNVLSTS